MSLRYCSIWDRQVLTSLITSIPLGILPPEIDILIKKANKGKDKDVPLRMLNVMKGKNEAGQSGDDSMGIILPNTFVSSRVAMRVSIKEREYFHLQ